MRICVTGGCGFIGSNFIRLVIEQKPGWQVVNLDKLTYAGNPANLADIEDNDNYSFIHGDICNPEDAKKAIKGADAIINFAAETHVDRSISDPDTFLKTDILGTNVLLEECRKAGTGRFIQISTDEVYGEAPQNRASVENDALMPCSPYAASKAGADRLAYSFFVTYGTPVVITRCSNNLGPRQYPEKLLPLFITNAIEGKELPMYGTGLNTRDWIHVMDHCRAVLTLVEHPGIEGEVFNIGTNTEKNVREIAEIIMERTGCPADRLVKVTDRPGHVKRHAVDPSKLMKTTGWTPKYDFETAIEETIAWYGDHPDWWKPIKDGRFADYYKKHYGSGR